MKLEFCGHSCFIISYNEHSVIIDPFLTGNPQATKRASDVSVEAVILTHGHGDHIGDWLSIAQKNNATIIAPYELAMYCEKKGAPVHPLHIGGGYNFPFGRVKLTPAWHGSAIMDDSNICIYTGSPCGVLITMGGKTVYHSGDTGLFGDMRLIGECNSIDVALLPIGDNFTMGIQDALYALKLLNPRKVIPMHYNTFPIIAADPDAFAKGARELKYECIILKPGESVTI